MADSSPPKRPSLGLNALRRPSYLDDHLEYKSRPGAAPTSIDGLIKDDGRAPTADLARLSLSSSHKSHGLVGLSPPPITAADTGAIYSISHTNCVSSPADAPRLVATIFYNSAAPKHPHLHADRSSPPTARDILPPPEIATGSAPTTNILNYPLEPPVPEPEPLDHIYGPYISELCLTHFLAVLDSLLIHNHPAQRRLTSSHRCLAADSAKPRIVEMIFSPPPNPEYLPTELLSKHEAIYKFEREWNCEVILQPSSAFRRHKRLCVFDMDSTLIRQEVIDEIAAVVGVQKAVSAITERAMNGELDFEESLRARVALLKGVPSDVFEQLKPKITITPGARELCKCLKKLGFSLAVLSGGFQPLADWLAAELGLDHAFANHLVSDPLTHTLTGELDANYPIVDAAHKRNLLLSLASGKGVSLKQTMAVGDGANDIPMLKTAGLGVAWNAKSKVQMDAPARLNVGESMLDLIYLLGLTKTEVDELLAS